MQYTQITITTTTEASEIIAYILEENGSEGVNIVDINDIRAVLNDKQNWDYVDNSILSYNDERVFVKGFFNEKTNVLPQIMESLEELKTTAVIPLGSLEVSSSKIDSCDWENEWRKYYVPIELKNVVIVPAWLKYDGKTPIKVYIEPGMAFGTGNHETTGMCIKLLQDFDLTGKKIADIGCGSGILGVSALKLGAKHCIFNDIDSQAIEATQSNLKLNNISNGFTLIKGDLEMGEDKADVVIANITADILIRLCSILKDNVKTGGVVIISGIINARANDVLNAFSKHFDLIKINKKGEWQAMSLIKR